MALAWEDYLDALAAFGMRPGLERVRALLSALGEPQHAFRAVHVVGTNGKSSTTRYVEALLRGHGRRSGAYLSPHLSGYHERVLVDGRPLAAAAFGAAVGRVREAIVGLPEDLGETTQFEVLTVAALLAFAEAGVEAAAVEAGLGGRLDATHVLQAPVVVLTNIALDHTDILGDTRELIFAEKAAVIHGGDAVFGPLEGLEGLADERCAQVGARPHHWGREVTAWGTPDDFTVRLAEAGRARSLAGLRLPTHAAYQVTNAALAMAAADLLLGGLDEDCVRRALTEAAVPGRLQVVWRRPLVLADGAHNPHGMAALGASLRAIERPRPRVLLLAMMRDKAVDEVLALVLPLVEQVVCTQARQARSLSAAELAARVRAVSGAGSPPALAIEDATAAYEAALALAGDEGSLLVTGSLYLLEDLKEIIVPKGAMHE